MEGLKEHPNDFSGYRVTRNAFARTIHVKTPAGTTGTAFALDVEGEQYLVSACHVIDGCGSGTELAAVHDGTWKKFNFELISKIGSPGDVAVMKLPFEIYPSVKLEPNANYAPGQECFFLGFPYAMDNFNIGKLVGAQAFVKKAIIAGSLVTKHGVELYLDGINNAGFSGGPVVKFNPHTNSMDVLGVIHSYKPDVQQTVDDPKAPTGHSHFTLQNSGLVKATLINTVQAMIQHNKLGLKAEFEVKVEESHPGK